jgi:hypothetical protein
MRTGIQLTGTGQWFLFHHPGTPLACISCAAKVIGGDLQECERKLTRIEGLKQQAEERYRDLYESFSHAGAFSEIRELLFSAGRIAGELGLSTEVLAITNRSERIAALRDQFSG